MRLPGLYATVLLSVFTTNSSITIVDNSSYSNNNTSNISIIKSSSIINKSNNIDTWIFNDKRMTIQTILVRKTMRTIVMQPNTVVMMMVMDSRKSITSLRIASILSLTSGGGRRMNSTSSVDNLDRLLSVRPHNGRVLAALRPGPAAVGAALVPALPAEAEALLREKIKKIVQLFSHRFSLLTRKFADMYSWRRGVATVESSER